jgi:two-component system CheB/CheR fusion protein
LRPGASSLKLPVALLLSQLTVLVVDPDSDNLELLSAYLELEGATVLQASSVAAALEAATSSASPIHAVVSELLLADGDGCELLRRLRAQPGRQSVSALALTALTDPDWRRRALDGGFQACATKPFPLVELAPQLAALCHR